MVYAFPIVSGMWESLPPVCGRLLFSAKALARFQVMEWSILAELITSIASGIVVRISGFSAERRISYGCATIDTPPSRLIWRIVSSADSLLGTASDTPRPMMCPSRLDISIPGIISSPCGRSLARTLWSVIARPSRPLSLHFGTSSSGRVCASDEAVVWT